MDNLTHTLSALALAEAGLKHKTRLGVAALLLGANLPDIDVLAYIFGSGLDALSFRRGWTHGILAMAVLPVLLAGMLLTGNRMVSRNRDGIRPAWLLALAAIGIVSHPLLDLLNVYGVRLLMPFSSRWFYGDALFIVDPWIWLTLGLGIVLTRWRARRNARPRPSPGRPARTALILGTGYAVAMAVAGQLGEGAVERQARGDRPRRTLAAPVFGNPFRRDVIRELDGGYELGGLVLRAGWRYTPATLLSKGGAARGAAAAARSREGVAFLGWSRFPLFESDSQDTRLRVTLSDVRYRGKGNRSWASVTLLVP